MALGHDWSFGKARALSSRRSCSRRSSCCSCRTSSSKPSSRPSSSGIPLLQRDGRPGRDRAPGSRVERPDRELGLDAVSDSAASTRWTPRPTTSRPASAPPAMARPDGAEAGADRPAARSTGRAPAARRLNSTPTTARRPALSRTRRPWSNTCTTSWPWPAFRPPRRVVAGVLIDAVDEGGYLRADLDRGRRAPGLRPEPASKACWRSCRASSRPASWPATCASAWRCS